MREPVILFDHQKSQAPEVGKTVQDYYHDYFGDGASKGTSTEPENNTTEAENNTEAEAENDIPAETVTGKRPSKP